MHYGRPLTQSGIRESTTVGSRRQYQRRLVLKKSGLVENLSDKYANHGLALDLENTKSKTSRTSDSSRNRNAIEMLRLQQAGAGAGGRDRAPGHGGHLSLLDGVKRMHDGRLRGQPGEGELFRVPVPADEGDAMSLSAAGSVARHLERLGMIEKGAAGGAFAVGGRAGKSAGVGGGSVRAPPTKRKFQDLCSACQWGDSRLVKAFCINAKEYLNCTDDDGFTPL